MLPLCVKCWNVELSPPQMWPPSLTPSPPTADINFLSFVLHAAGAGGLINQRARCEKSQTAREKEHRCRHSRSVCLCKKGSAFMCSLPIISPHCRAAPARSLSHTHIHSASFYTLAHGASERSSGCYGRVIYFFIHTRGMDEKIHLCLCDDLPCASLMASLCSCCSIFLYTVQNKRIKICDGIYLARAKPTRAALTNTHVFPFLTNRERNRSNYLVSVRRVCVCATFHYFRHSYVRNLNFTLSHPLHVSFSFSLSFANTQQCYYFVLHPVLVRRRGCLPKIDFCVGMP